MTEEMEEMDVWKNNIQQDIQEIKSKQDTMQSDIHHLQLNDGLQDREISVLHTTLASIQDDTRWIRRMITKAIVGTIIAGLIGGTIGFLFTQLN